MNNVVDVLSKSSKWMSKYLDDKVSFLDTEAINYVWCRNFELFESCFEDYRDCYMSLSYKPSTGVFSEEEYSKYYKKFCDFRTLYTEKVSETQITSDKYLYSFDTPLSSLLTNATYNYLRSYGLECYGDLVWVYNSGLLPYLEKLGKKSLNNVLCILGLDSSAKNIPTCSVDDFMSDFRRIDDGTDPEIEEYTYGDGTYTIRIEEWFGHILKNGVYLNKDDLCCCYCDPFDFRWTTKHPPIAVCIALSYISKYNLKDTLKARYEKWRESI